MRKKLVSVATSSLMVLGLVANLNTGLSYASANNSTDGLILSYQFDGTKGNAVEDSSGHNNNGIWGGTATIGKDGKSGGALDLDGKGYVQLPNGIFKGMNQITISTWVKFTPDSNSFWQRIFDLGKDTSSFFFASKNRTCNLNINGNVEGPASNGIFPDDQWEHIAVTYDGKTMTYYENGVQTAQTVGKNKLSDLEDSVANYIGKSKFDADPMLKADIDDFRIYDRALSADEVKALRSQLLNDSDRVAQEKDELTLGDTTKLVNNIKLPTTGDENTTITWSSDNKALVADDGTITRPDTKDDGTADLTATIKSGNASDTKTFKVTVFPAGKTHYSIDVNVNKPKFDISPVLTGAFFEDINHAADGGLYAELVNNRSFENDNKLDAWTVVKLGKGDGTVASATAKPLNSNNPTYVSINVKNPGDGVGLSNSGYKGIAVKKAAKYDFTIWARTQNNYSGDIKAEVTDQSGKVISNVAKISKITNGWKKYSLVLTANETTDNANLVVLADKAGIVDADMVSLFPEDTWKGRKYGLRKDLAQLIADMKPKFMRFPGGCIVEGKDQKDMYEWKDTIGSIETRKQNSNFWGYYQTYGLGFYEYFQFCEDIGAQPLPVINAGMAFQDATGPNYKVDFDSMQPYIQDALDLVEYANGPVTSTWGKKRAAAGHPKPFNLKYIEIGNENTTADFWYRYQMIQDAVKEKYPNIQVICGSGAFDSGTDFDDAWTNWIPRMAPTAYVDEHYYMGTQWFLDSVHRYDNYSIKSNSVYAGEYAAQNAGKTNTLGTALSEAAFMTGLEKNSDVVKMSSYAPLLSKADDHQWTPDAIWFNGSQAYGTPDYYVQKMFSSNVGDKLLDSTKKTNFTESSTAISGGLILGSWNTGVEYDDVKVTSNTDNKVIFSDDFSTKKPDWKKGDGNWTVKDGKLVLTDNTTDCRYTLYNDKWSNYTLTLKAKKTSGSEGFLVGFAATDPNNYYWLNLGGWSNTKSVVEQAVGGGKSTIVTTPDKFSKIETGQDYDIKIVVHNNGFECYVNGDLAAKFAKPNVEKDFYTVSSYDSKANQVIVKVVNTTGGERNSEINLTGVSSVEPKGTAMVLTSDSQNDQNSFAEPTKVAPVTKTVDCFAPKFTYTFPKNSVTIFRINVKK